MKETQVEVDGKLIVAQLNASFQIYVGVMIVIIIDSDNVTTVT